MIQFPLDLYCTHYNDPKTIKVRDDHSTSTHSVFWLVVRKDDMTAKSDVNVGDWAEAAICKKAYRKKA